MIITRKVVFLLKDFLEDNNIPPDKLHCTLKKYTTSIKQYLNIQDLNIDEQERFMTQDITFTVEAFINLLQLCSDISKEDNKLG